MSDAKSVTAPAGGANDVGGVGGPLPGVARRWPFLPWLIGGLAVAGAWLWWRQAAGSAGAGPVFRTARIQRGDVVQSVSATGPLSAVATVEVGSQVSGNIAKLHVDFNDHVSAGQLVAEIDPATYEARLIQAEGDFAGAQASCDLKRLGAKRAQELFAKQLVAPAELDQALAELRQQQAVVQIKEAAVRSARVDLERTKIRSPIDGVVIDRAIDVGQTVQASFAAPTLFKLAHDLREMQITANVSEADIGGVQPGQAVTFTVDAFSGQTFAGQVREVRNNTTITNNVVTYPAVITLRNADLKLRPGMTANVTITLAKATGVLRAPNAALRFVPPETAEGGRAGPPGAGAGRTLYVVRGPVDPGGRATGPLEAVPVRTGLSDATHTEIVAGIDEGSVVATGTSLQPPSGATPGGGVTNPFVPKMPGAHGGKR